MKKIFLFKLSLRFLYCIGILFTLLSSCSKQPEFNYGVLASIEGLTIQDIAPFDDSLLFVAGNHSEFRGKIIKYNNITKEYTTLTTNFIVHDIVVYGNVLWAAGDSMLLYKSVDTGKTWNPYNDFNYFWSVDKADFKELYVFNNKPWFAIGGKNLLNGNFYYKNPNTYYPFASKQLQAGVNDMLVIDSSTAYLACYGSILQLTDLGKTKTYEKIGNHNFSGITLADSATLLACTFEGTIHRKEFSDSSWKEVVHNGIPFRFIAADPFGNAIAIGDDNSIYKSKNSGLTWKIQKYTSGNDISALTYENGIFYIGTNAGIIHAVTKSQMEQEVIYE
jgi:photosystem II stability/assembly factor-like uncharacterized protein